MKTLQMKRTIASILLVAGQSVVTSVFISGRLSITLLRISGSGIALLCRSGRLEDAEITLPESGAFGVEVGEQQQADFAVAVDEVSEIGDFDAFAAV